MISVKKITLSGILAAFSLIAFMLENLVPPIFVVGGRLGIANFFVLTACIYAGFWYGAGILTVKSLLGSILTGNAMAILYSLPAGIIAYIIQMVIVFYAPKISVVAASVVGGVINACLQNVAFCIITSTPEYLAYLPYLALVGAIGGATVGAAVFLTIKFLPEKFSGPETKE